MPTTDWQFWVVSVVAPARGSQTRQYRPTDGAIDARPEPITSGQMTISPAAAGPDRGGCHIVMGSRKSPAGPPESAAPDRSKPPSCRLSSPS